MTPDLFCFVRNRHGLCIPSKHSLAFAFRIKTCSVAVGSHNSYQLIVLVIQACENLVGVNAFVVRIGYCCCRFIAYFRCSGFYIYDFQRSIIFSLVSAVIKVNNNIRYVVLVIELNVPSSQLVHNVAAVSGGQVLS